jgi:hypothetical protein
MEKYGRPEISQTSIENYQGRLVESFQKRRLDEAEPSFEGLYSTWQNDMSRVQNLTQMYANDENDQIYLGKLAEALIFKELTEHPISQVLTFRGSSLYDDYFNGVDVVVDPKNGQVQALATLDITINQKDIKGSQYQNSEAGEARPVGFEQKLARSKRYVDTLASYDPGHAREVLSWMQSGGLHEPVTNANKNFFAEAERLMLMKYYMTPPGASEPNKPGFVIGGPQVIVSADTMFVNKALQAQKGNEGTLGDLAALEFAACIQAGQKYNETLVRQQRSRNVLFDTHYSKVQAWQRMFERSELSSIINDVMRRRQNNRDFGQQLGYYANTFEKVFGRG